MEIYKIDIIEKINNLLKENLDEILSKTPIIEQEIKDLELLSKEKILTSKDNKERMRYGAQMEKFGLKSLLKFINSLGNKALGKLNQKIIESIFRVPLKLKIWNDSIDKYKTRKN